MAKTQAKDLLKFPIRELDWLDHNGYKPLKQRPVRRNGRRKTAHTLDREVYLALELLHTSRRNQCWVRITGSRKIACTGLRVCRWVKFIYDDEGMVVGVDCVHKENFCDDGTRCRETHDPKTGFYSCTCPEDGRVAKKPAKKAGKKASKKTAKKAKKKSVKKSA